MVTDTFSFSAQARGGRDRFHSEFPSLEEQESMSKRELEELRERRARGEDLPGPRHHPERGWGDPPSGPPHGPPHRPYPPPHGPYPPHHYGPYMMPHIRHGEDSLSTSLLSLTFPFKSPAPPYGSGPMAGGREGPYPPPPHPMGYGRPPYPPYPQTNPFDV